MSLRLKLACNDYDRCRALIDGTVKPDGITLDITKLKPRELFPRTTGDTFDPLSPATVAADVTIGFVLQTDRAARLVGQHAVNPALPGLEDVIDRLTAATFDASTATAYEAAVRRAEERVLVDRLMWLALGAPNSQVRAIASLKLSKLATRLRTAAARTEADTAQRTLIAADIKRFLERPLDPSKPVPLPAPGAPPGAPIGDPGPDWLASPPWCAWNGDAPERWLFVGPPF